MLKPIQLPATKQKSQVKLPTSNLSKNLRTTSRKPVLRVTTQKPLNTNIKITTIKITTTTTTRSPITTNYLPMRIEPMIVQFESKDINENADANITCVVKAFGNFAVNILKVYQTSPPNQQRYKSKSFNSPKAYLTLVKVKKEDAGVYRCLVLNYWGNDKAIAFVNVNYIPNVNIVQPQTKFVVPHMKLTCFAEGFPPPNIKWYKGDSLLQQVKISQRSGQLTIQVQNPGEYKCIGWNRIGYRLVRIYIENFLQLPIPKLAYLNRTSRLTYVKLTFAFDKRVDGVVFQCSRDQGRYLSVKKALSSNSRYFLSCYELSIQYRLKAYLVWNAYKSFFSNTITVPKRELTRPAKPVIRFNEYKNYQPSALLKGILPISLNKSLSFNLDSFIEEYYAIIRYRYRLYQMEYISHRYQLADLLDDIVILPNTKTFYVTKLKREECYQIQLYAHNAKGLSDVTRVSLTTGTWGK